MKKFWLGLALGALVAGAAVFLYAPQSGTSTRRKLRRGFEDLGDNLNEAAEYVKEQAERLAKEAQQILDGGKKQLDASLGSFQEFAKQAESDERRKYSRVM